MQSNITEIILAGGHTFRFSLCRKTEKLGNLSIDQWWMPITALYGQRNHREKDDGNLRAICSCFWAACNQHQTTNDADVQESYILVNILPITRNQGSRNIFPDAFFTSHSQESTKKRAAAVEDLERLLRQSKDERMDKITFRDRTGAILGPPLLTPEAEAEYRRFCQDFFAPLRQFLLVDKEAAIAKAKECWHQKMKSVGRRSGKAVEKMVLDVISYESRAALHRCYSLTWMVLLPHLMQKYQLSPESAEFLRFWHLEQSEVAAEEVACYFHLFHGHVFALHPATGEFMRTPTGKGLVADWLTNLDSQEAFEQVLYGLYLTCYHYATQRDDVAFSRKKQPKSVTDDDLINLQE